MTATAIFDKYAQALIDLGMGEDAPIHADAILLALRLAIGDAYTAGADSVLMQALDKVQVTPEQRQAESLQAQIERLNEWLAANRIALYHNPDLDTAAAMIQACEETMRAKIALHIERDNLHQQLIRMDADNAGLAQRLREAQDEIDRLSRQNVIAVDTFNSLAAERHASTNGNGAAPQGDWWMNLDAETNDYRISLDAGRRKFREVPKHARLLLAQAFARHIGGGALPKQSEFDAHKPDWMPGGGGLVTTFGCNWSELLAVSPFEVAP